MNDLPNLPDWARAALDAGMVIPAHPLALDRRRRFDQRRQRALSRYYHAAGAGGVAVGVHTTQFAIRDSRHGLFKPVLELAAETIRHCDLRTGRQTLRVAGICGPTPQAVAEAAFARQTGYHAGLLSLSALRDAGEDQLIEHCRRVSEQIALIGFYLQPAVGGRLLPFTFWERFLDIPNVVAIKIAAFNRYQTLDVVRAVAQSGRRDVALYTGNDDNIVADLLTEYEFETGTGRVRVGLCGGLLGHWACWTRQAVALLEECRQARRSPSVPAPLLTKAGQVTDCNAAFFDAANGFAGCIAGIHEVLRRQGLLETICCLDPGETLSPGQREEIDRVCRAYPHLNDDCFVADHIEEWMG